MLGQIGAGEVGVIEGRIVARKHGDVEGRCQVQVRRHLAELQVKVDQQDPLLRCGGPIAGEQDGGVYCEGCGSHAPLGREEGDDLPRGDAVRIEPIALVTARPSATIRSKVVSRRATTASAGVGTTVTGYPAVTSSVSRRSRSSPGGAQSRIGLAGIG